MKVLFLNTSEEENGLLSKGIALCCAKLTEMEIEYDVRWVKDVHPCTSCGKCLKRRRCLFEGIINELHEHSEEFDALIIGSDVMYSEASKQAIELLKCLFRSNNENYVGKIGGVILASNRRNTEHAYQELNRYFSYSCMPVVSGRYWNTVCDDAKDTEEMERLAQNISWLLKCISSGKEHGIQNRCFVEKLDAFMLGR